jgi:hypothetical protein
MPGRSRFRWNEDAGRYVDARGRFVSRAQVRAEIDRTLLDADRTARALAEQLRSRAISLEQWHREMRGLVKSTHLANAAAARGGWAQVTAADLGRVGQTVRREYAYLHKFAGEIERGLPLDGRFLRRVELYTEAGRMTYHRVEREEMRARGFDEEQNVLAPADHCAGCLAATARGWAPIGALVAIGSRDCRSRCRCRLVYRVGATHQQAA